jgi:adenine-specific DNA-methyltransferase
MALIEEKISEINDPELRKDIEEEVRDLKDLLTEKSRFGLIFERHLPELVPLYNQNIRKGDTVAKKIKQISDTFRVLKLQSGTAQLVRDSDSTLESVPLDSLVLVRRAGEAIYPALNVVDEVHKASFESPQHVLIEADNFHALQLLQYIYRERVDCLYLDPPYNTGARDWKYNNSYVDKSDQWRHSKWLSFMNKRLRLAKTLLKPDMVCLS